MLTLMIIVFFGCMLIGVPMAYSAGLATISYVLTSGIPLTVLAQQMFVSADNFSMIAIPLFILAGDFMNNGGITKAIMHFARALVGHIRGSLAHVTILANMMFAAMSGSANAACAVMGSMMIPEMKDEGYDDGFACAVTASSSILGPIIPPSIIFVLYGSITGTPVSSLLLAGIVPGVLIGLFFMIAAYLFARVHKYPTSAHVSWKERLSAFVHAIPALMAPLIIVGGILSGIFTATEAGAIAALYALIVGFVTKQLTVKVMWRSVLNAAKVTAAILFMTGTAKAFAWVLTSRQIPQKLAAAIMSISSNQFTFFLLTVLFLLLIGCFIVETASVPILAPIFAPLAAQFGINPVHFGVIFVLLVSVGALTPPVGSMLFVSAKVGETPVTKIIRNLTPFYIALLAALILLIAIPELVTFLPSLVK